MKYITRTVWVLSVVSLLTDMASEMLYPVMPVYLQSIGFSIALIGFFEGVAEAMAGLSKGYFGKLSDITGRRVPFVRLGYFLSAVSKPLMAIFAIPAWILFVRTLDRLGKGLRTGARDAMLSDESTVAHKAKVFGFHRSMDTAGAFLGPSLALLFLYFYPGQYTTLFLVAFIPGLLAIAATFMLREKKTRPANPLRKPGFLAFIHFWKTGGSSYRKLTGALLLFALVNSSDVFLLLKAKQSGMSDQGVIMVYIFYNLVYALFAFPAGILADRIGLKKTFVAGLFLFSLVYLGMSVCTGWYWMYFLFFLYGLYAAATEGISKAWITNIVPAGDVATAIGTYTAFQSICALLASTLTGLIWYGMGASAAFIITASVSFFTALYFIFAKISTTGNSIAGA